MAFSLDSHTHGHARVKNKLSQEPCRRNLLHVLRQIPWTSSYLWACLSPCCWRTARTQHAPVCGEHRLARDPRACVRCRQRDALHQCPSQPCYSATASIPRWRCQSKTHPQCHISTWWLMSASATAWLWILTLANFRTLGHPSTHRSYLIRGQCFWGAYQDEYWLIWDRDNTGIKLLGFRDTSETVLD